MMTRENKTICRLMWSYWWGFKNALNFNIKFSDLHKYVDNKCKEMR